MRVLKCPSQNWNYVEIGTSVLLKPFPQIPAAGMDDDAGRFRFWTSPAPCTTTLSLLCPVFNPHHPLCYFKI